MRKKYYCEKELEEKSNKRFIRNSKNIDIINILFERNRMNEANRKD